MHTQFQSEKPEGRDNLGDPVVDGKTILKRILNTYGVNLVLLAQDADQ
jgi:hypothetical protein